jgi:hypothetical protein
MLVHANAKLGPAGRFAMVRLIDEGGVAAGGRGCLRRVAQRLLIAGGIVGTAIARLVRCWIGRAGRTGHRGCCRRSWRSGSFPHCIGW